MLRLIRNCCAALAFMVGISPAFAIDPFFPTFGNNGIDVLHYNLELDVQPVAGGIEGKAALFIKAQRRLTRFKLDLHALTVSSVKINGHAAGFSQANDKLTITPASPIDEGDIFWLSVAYAGVPDPLPDPTSHPEDEIFLGWFKFGKAAYVVSEPVGASTFYPANDEPTDKATFTIGVTVPQGYTGVANGFYAGSKQIGTNRRFQWVMLKPMTTWLATVHVNKFNLDLSHAPDGTPIRTYTPEGIPQSHVEAYALAGKMLTHFEKLIGPRGESILASRIAL